MSVTLTPRRSHNWYSVGLCIGLMAVLSACAQSPQVVVDQTPEAVQYQARAARHYDPPGPPSDPWGPYIIQAAQRFDVPIEWVRAVMRVESGGRMYEFGTLITSPVGAMGLMQVMPETYDGLRQRYALSDDAYDPLNNILAGTAYIREMYDIYGSPAFLAAYNAGPARLDDYLNNRRGLPNETRHYIAKAGPNVVGIYPGRRSPADDLAYNQIPLDIPVGLRYPRPQVETRVAQNTPPKRSSASVTARNARGQRPAERPVEVAQMPEPPQIPANATPAHTAADPRLSPPAKVRLVAQNVAANVRVPPPATAKSHTDVKAAPGPVHAAAGAARPTHGTADRPRLISLSCDKPAKGHGNCVIPSANAHI